MLFPIAANAQSAVRTFESDAVGVVPSGCSTPDSAAAAIVTDELGYHSKHSLQAGSAAQVICPVPARTGAEFTFEIYPAAVASNVQFALRGHLDGIPDTEQPVFQAGIASSGALQWFDHGGWTRVSAPGAFRTGQWNQVRVHLPAAQERAYISVNGHYVAPIGPVGVRAVADITGFQFLNGTGDHAYIDDVALGAPTGPDPSDGPFRVGPDVTVASSPELAQMPNTAVNTYPDGRQRTLLLYGTHTDTSDGAGNQLAGSEDGGSTWQSVNDLNPMPDAPSYMLSRLSNGDILAVDYHTYMVDGSDNLQAEVPTAISHDQGKTWTQRSGIMTAPQTMRPISTVTDRPGHPLGGFVMVHSVVENPDGSLLQSGYGYYQDDKKYRQIVLRSTDEGENWTVAATAAYSPNLPSEGFCEGGIERVADGSLMIVMRTGSYQTMYFARSRDDGATWSAPQPLLAGPKNQPVVGIYPTLTLMPNGTLVLYIGRPGQSILASKDGTGRSWSTPQTIDYLNDGNGGTLVMGRNKLLVFGDRGANWSTPTPATYRIWTRIVTVP
ncbi:MAG TPA: sialidase family protein [Mycobacteriales bacterium]|nr:sialidase family protein [Mycobacteriales bacterium]